jgi:hypothetical protein
MMSGRDSNRGPTHRLENLAIASCPEAEPDHERRLWVPLLAQLAPMRPAKVSHGGRA